LADTRGPFELGHVSGLLAGRQARRVMFSRQGGGAALGRRDGHGTTHAPWPFGHSQVSGLLARQQARRVWVGRQDGVALYVFQFAYTCSIYTFYTTANTAMTPFCAFFTASSQIQHPLIREFLSHGHTILGCSTLCQAVAASKSLYLLTHSYLSILPNCHRGRATRIRLPFRLHGIITRYGCSARAENSCTLLRSTSIIRQFTQQ
jgi:hypothetical protein